MTYHPWRDYRLSSMMLGTVQLGLPYGIANHAGQPDYEEARAIVKTALDGGVNCFDTAATYGSSEEVLGRVLADLGVAERVVVVTKIQPLRSDELADETLAFRGIEASVAESRRRLGLDCLPVVLFHREVEARYLSALEPLQARGWVRYIGVSCDNRPGPAGQFAATPGVAALQIPANLLDPRHCQGGSLSAAAAHEVAVFIRSVFLQGLLLMPEEAVPAALQAVIPVRRQLSVLAEEAGMTLAELAVRYVLGLQGVTSALLGAETAAQVQESLRFFNHGALNVEVQAALEKIVPRLPETLLTPSLWQTVT
ncbi:MAG: aldo/keto reductase [candidate division WS1 bacterium]|nr:aldo/keto reductase [candidate division WS1 bacterium]